MTELTFTLKDVITIAIVLVSVTGSYWAVRMKIQKLDGAKADKKDLETCIEKMGKEFNQTVRELKDEVRKGIKEMVGTYHELEIKQVTFEAKAQTTNDTQDKNIEALWEKMNKIVNERKS